MSHRAGRSAGVCRAGRRAARIAAALIALALPSHAPASLDAASTAATLRVAPADAPRALTQGDFSVAMWVRLDQPVSVSTSLFDVRGTFSLRLDEGGRAVARIEQTTSGPPALAAEAPGALRVNEWSLIVASFDVSEGRLRVWSVGESVALSSAEAVSPGVVPGPIVSEGILGETGLLPGAAARLGVLSVRREVMSEVDVQAVWSSRRNSALFDMNTIGQGGAMTGEIGCRWMVNHATATLPADTFLGAYPPGQIASVVGQPATTTNVIILNRDSSIFPDEIRAVRPTTMASGMTFSSVFDGPGGSFWTRDISQVTSPLPDPPRVAAVAPRARRLLDGPAGLWRVATSSNSRGVKRFDGSGFSPGNYMHGFTALLSDQTAGVMYTPAFNSKTPWFGFDAGQNSPYMSGSVTSMGNHDYSRFWTGSSTNGGTGPGGGVLLYPGAGYALRCKPEGMIVAEQPLVVRAHVLRRPGSSTLRWVPNKNGRQGLLGTDVGAPVDVDLDSTSVLHIYDPDAGDSVTSARLTLHGDLSGGVQVGDAVAYSTAISLITSVDYDGQTAGATTLGLAKPLGLPPGPGEEIRIGPWDFVTIEHEWPGLDAGDGQVWRGLRLESLGDGGCIALFGFDAWRPGVDGFVWAALGWGGNGYDPQMTATFDEAFHRWIDILSPDVWLQMFAQQLSAPESMATWTAAVRAAAPFADIVWVGDMEHSSSFEAWHRYILNEAGPKGVAASALLQHERLGTMLEQLADGLRADGNHVSQRGNERLAELWLEDFAQILLPPPLPGDVDGDGMVGFADLNIALSNFGLQGQGLGGDVDYDNDVDFADLNMLLGSFGAAAP